MPSLTPIDPVNLFRPPEWLSNSLIVFTDTLRQILIDQRVTRVFSTQTAAYTTQAVDYEVVCVDSASPVTVTINNAVADAQELIVKRIGTGAVTVDGDTYNIDGAGTQSLAAQYDAIHLVWCGSEWSII